MRAAGFSLIEALIATAVLTAGVLSLAGLFDVSARANRIANAATTTVLAAEEKMEQLRTDARLGTSPTGALTTDTVGYFDHGPGYLRRWSVEPLSIGAANAIVLHVVVIPLVDRAPEGAVEGSARPSGEIHLVTIRRHQAG